MFNHIRNILVFFPQLFADPVGNNMGIFKRHARLNKQAPIDLDISPAPSYPDFMTVVYSINFR